MLPKVVCFFHCAKKKRLFFEKGINCWFDYVVITILSFVPAICLLKAENRFFIENCQSFVDLFEKKSTFLFAFVEMFVYLPCQMNGYFHWAIYI
jgi:hypothetical protein